MKIKDFYCDTYLASVRLAYSGSFQDFVEYLEDNGAEVDFGDHYDCSGCVVDVTIGDEPFYLVWVESKRNLDILVHETLHLVFKIFKDRDVAFGHDNEEHLAYYVAKWFNAFYDAMKTKKKK